MQNSAYFLNQDNDSHWYVVPQGRRKEWDEWLEIPADDEASWDVPDFATPVGGAPSLVTFTADGFTIG